MTNLRNHSIRDDVDRADSIVSDWFGAQALDLKRKGLGLASRRRKRLFDDNRER